jgi:manganese oxidase
MSHGMRKKLFIILISPILLLSATLVQAATDLPPSAKVDIGPIEPVCSNFISPEARKAQVIDGVAIQESLLCDPDAPEDIAAFVKGTNNVSMETPTKSSSNSKWSKSTAIRLM